MAIRLTSFKAKVFLAVITIIALAVFNLDTLSRGKSLEQRVYEEWLNNFEGDARQQQSSKYRLVEVSADGKGPGSLVANWKVSGVDTEYTKLERLLELLRESNVFSWGVNPPEIPAELTSGIRIRVQAADFNAEVLASTDLISQHLTIKNFLKLLELHSSKKSKG